MERDLRGSLLIAHKRMADEYFRHTIILVTQHSEQGSVGVILNLRHPHLSEQSGMPVYLGGPIHTEQFLVLHGFPEWAKEPRPKMPKGAFVAPSEPFVPGVYFGDGFDLKKISKLSMPEHKRARVIYGYSAWYPDQLEREINHMAWYVTPATGHTLWIEEPENMWTGFSPKTIPAFSVN